MNKIRGQLSLEIGGQVYQAHLSVNSLCALETVLDSEVTEIISNFLSSFQRQRISLRVVRAFLWAMLRDSKPELTLEDAGNLVQEATMTYVVAKIIEIIPITFPDPSGEGDKPDRPK